ncbi:MAG: NFACT family protein [Chloroflexi bacterium]|nr:NFACT family protein [Chloroflexota bacterium]
MGFDSLAVTAARQELEPLLVGAQIQELAFSDTWTLTLTAYRPATGRIHLLASAHPERSRVLRSAAPPRRGVERDTPFMLLTRKYLRNAWIVAFEQPGLERVLTLHCVRRLGEDADSRDHRIRLVVEAMGRRANLLLVDENDTILDAWRRTPPSRNAIRPILPHLPYELPPAQVRLPVTEPGLMAAAARAGEHGGTLAKYLGETLEGASPLAAREIAFRASGASAAPLVGADWARVSAAALQLYAPVRGEAAWEPCVVLVDNAPIDAAVFWASHVEHERGAQLEAATTASEAFGRLETAGGTGRPAAGLHGPLAGERAALASQIETVLKAERRKAGALRRELERSESVEQLRRWGELVLAFAWHGEVGATALQVEGERIPLDPGRTTWENAQAYFAAYQRARDTRKRLPALVQAVEARIEYLATLHTLAESAATPEVLRTIKSEIGADSPARPVAKKGTRQKPGGSASGPYRRFNLGDGWELLVGSSARGNARVTFELAGPEDLWLHARNVPGAHAILRATGRAQEPPSDVLLQAAGAAAHFSSARANSLVEVDVAPRRYVKKIPEAPPGLVRYTHERTLRVQPRPPLASSVQQPGASYRD